MTANQIKDESKTVTRRHGWLELQAGDFLRPVLKCKGKQERLLTEGCYIEVVNVTTEPLSIISQEECAKEGFPEMTPLEFIDMIVKLYCGTINKFSEMTRIEFKYVSDGADLATDSLNRAGEHEAHKPADYR